MAVDSGINFLLKIEDSEGSGTYTTIGNFTTNSFSIDNADVDITDKSSNHWKTSLETGGTRSVSISGTGFFAGTTQQDLLLTNAKTNVQWVYQIAFGDSNTITGSFEVASMSFAGAHDGAQTFDISLRSTGTITYV